MFDKLKKTDFKFPESTRILVTGGDGQLGQELKTALVGRGAADIAVFAGRQRLDVTDSKAVDCFVAEGRFSHIVNCAAYTAVDRAETERDLCRAVNVEGALNVARAASRHGCRLIHLSTDYVFDGQKRTPYTESDTPSPLSFYGLTKFESEKAVIENAPDSVIIRTGWLYSDHGHNFMRTIVKRAAEGCSLRVVDDQTGTPTNASDVAEVILRIIAANPERGVYNYADAGQTSWYEFARNIVDLAGIKASIEPCSSARYGAPAPRPPYSVLSTRKIASELDITIPHWRDSLSRLIKNS